MAYNSKCKLVHGYKNTHEYNYNNIELITLMFFFLFAQYYFVKDV